MKTVGTVFYRIYSSQDLFLLCCIQEQACPEIYYLCDSNFRISSLSNSSDSSVLFRDLSMPKNRQILAEKFLETDAKDLSDTSCIDHPISESGQKANQWLVSYGSSKKELPLLAWYFALSNRHKIFAGDLYRFFQQIQNEKRSAEQILRTIPNALTIYENFRISGKHLDLQKLNEKSNGSFQYLCAVCGLSIQFESEQASREEVVSALLVNTANIFRLYQLPYFQTQLALKQSLLNDHQELTVDTNSHKIRKDRLTADDRSSQFAARFLCPNGELEDLPAISFEYPSKRMAQKAGIQPFNVMDRACEFFYKHFPDGPARKSFDKMVRVLRSLEGQNVNGSKRYQKKWDRPVLDLDTVSKEDLCLFLYDSQGNPSGSYVNFSFGGIHGSLYDHKRYQRDLQDDSVQPKPKLFLRQNGSARLNPRYAYTFAGLCCHEDFFSYYPGLLHQMDAFYDPQTGKDPYAQLINMKNQYDLLSKNPNLSKRERELYKNLRAGSKLILCAASGAAGSSWFQSIEMPNRILSMRLIGQLFTWQIAQMLTLQNAQVVSVNTDGIYAVLDPEKNAEIVQNATKDIAIQIVPEMVFLVSKNSSNRLEINPLTGAIQNASGSYLSGRFVPDPTHKPVQPPIVDWILSQYLMLAGYRFHHLSLDAPFDRDLARKLMEDDFRKMDLTRILLLYQIVKESRHTANGIIFGFQEHSYQPVFLDEVIRFFVWKKSGDHTLHLLQTNCHKISDSEKEFRKKNLLREQFIHAGAKSVLKKTGCFPEGEEFDIQAKELTNLAETDAVYLCNKNLDRMPETEKKMILEQLDLEYYLNLIESAYEKGWRNSAVQ